MPVAHLLKDEVLRRRLARGFGLLVLALSVIFIGREISRNWDALISFDPPDGFFIRCAVMVALYSALLFVLAEMWHRIVQLFGPEPRRRTYRSFTLSQIARYVPGNVVHLLGRAVLLRGGALSDKQLAMATFAELICLPVAALVILVTGVWFVPFDLLPFEAVGPVWPMLTISIAVLLTLVLGFFAFKQSLTLSALLLIALLAIAFLLGMSSVAAWVLSEIDDVPIGVVALAGVVSWLIGYATPGAPGGLGPREAAFIAILIGVTTPGSALIAAAVFRLITVAGDVICFAIGIALFRR